MCGGGGLTIECWVAIDFSELTPTRECDQALLIACESGRSGWWCGATMGGKSSKQKKEEVDRGNVIDTFKAK